MPRTLGLPLKMPVTSASLEPKKNSLADQQDTAVQARFISVLMWNYYRIYEKDLRKFLEGCGVE